MNATPPIGFPELSYTGTITTVLNDGDYRIFITQITAYAGWNSETTKYMTFQICCVITLDERWTRFVTPRVGRLVHIQSIKFFLHLLSTNITLIRHFYRSLPL
jgi:hypothetical protein